MDSNFKTIVNRPTHGCCCALGEGRQSQDDPEEELPRANFEKCNHFSKKRLIAPDISRSVFSALLFADELIVQGAIEGVISRTQTGTSRTRKKLKKKSTSGENPINVTAELDCSSDCSDLQTILLKSLVSSDFNKIGGLTNSITKEDLPVSSFVMLFTSNKNQIRVRLSAVTTLVIEGFVPLWFCQT